MRVIAVAILGAVGAGILAEYVLPSRYQATVLLKVSRSPMTGDATAIRPDFDFEVFKRTTAQLIKSPFVIRATLRKPAVARLEIVQKQQDPIAWLADNLTVDYPGDAEILRISMEGTRPEQLAMLVTEIKNAFLEEVVGEDTADRVRNKEKLAESVRRNEREIQQKSDAIRELEKKTGAGERAILLKRVALARLDNLVKRRATAEADIGELRMRLQVLSGQDAAAVKTQLSPSAVAVAVQKDPKAEKIITELKHLEKALDEEERRAREPNSRALERLKEAIAGLQKELDDQRSLIQADLEEKLTRPDGKDGFNKETLELQLKATAANWQALDQLVTKAVQEVQEIEESTAEIEAKKADVRGLREITDKMAHELKLMDMNMFMVNQRIVAIDESANVVRNNNLIRRSGSVGLAGMAGFFLAFVVAAWVQGRGMGRHA